MDPTHRMLLEATYEGFENGTMNLMTAFEAALTIG